MASSGLRLPPRLVSRLEYDRRTGGLARGLQNWQEQHVDPTLEPNPHDQYLLESDALQIFSFAGYGSAGRVTPGALPAVGAGWATLDIDTLNTTPRGITIDLVANTFSFDVDGVYAASISLGWEHNSSNQGRLTYVRVYNVTLAAPAWRQFTVATGRNAEATAYSLTTLLEVTEAQKGDLFRLEIGGGDAYSSVNWDVTEISLWNVGEWREPLPSNI